MTYIIYSQGVEVARKRSEAAAIKYARTLEEAQVVAFEQSGTYRSRTQIWPTKSPTHTL
jgi:hypothetical protein